MYKTYSVNYVENLERGFKTLVFLIGMLVPVLLYLIIKSKDVVFVERAGEGEKEPPSIEERVEAILAEKELASIRIFIHKTNKKLPYTKVDKIARLEQEMAKKYDVPLHIGLAITWKESTFKPLAVSPTGPIGAKQIAFSWWKDTCNLSSKEQLFDLDTNIECGYIAISKYKQQHGTWKKALAAYHGHPTDIQMNVNYSLTVLEKARKIQALIS